MNETDRSSSNASWLNVICGIWVAISPFVLGFTRFQATTWNNVAVGIVVMLLAFGRAGGNRAGSVLNVILGAWLVASSFVFGVALPIAFWNNIILGIVIAVVALVAGSQPAESRTAAPPVR